MGPSDGAPTSSFYLKSSFSPSSSPSSLSNVTHRHRHRHRHSYHDCSHHRYLLLLLLHPSQPQTSSIPTPTQTPPAKHTAASIAAIIAAIRAFIPATIAHILPGPPPPLPPPPPPPHEFVPSTTRRLTLAPFFPTRPARLYCHCHRCCCRRHHHHHRSHNNSRGIIINHIIREKIPQNAEYAIYSLFMRIRVPQRYPGTLRRFFHVRSFRSFILCRIRAFEFFIFYLFLVFSYILAWLQNALLPYANTSIPSHNGRRSFPPACTLPSRGSVIPETLLLHALFDSIPRRPSPPHPSAFLLATRRRMPPH